MNTVSLVSIVIPVFNRLDLLANKMEDVLNNKFLYPLKEINSKQPKTIKYLNGTSVNILVLKKLMHYYKLNFIFWNSI